MTKRCIGWDDDPHGPCEAVPEVDTNLCSECREGIEWLHAPLTTEELEAVNKVTREDCPWPCCTHNGEL